MFLNFLDDVFLLHFALETAQRIFQRLTFLNADFSHLEFTILPMHVAIIAINHKCYERSHSYITAYWHSLLADPSTEVKLCFFGPGLGSGTLPVRAVWDFPPYLLEYRSTHPRPRPFGAGQRDALMSLMRDAIGVLLAGGQGERLWPLTRDRAKPAVPFGGVYRIIDITLSNCINSDLRRVFVLTQYKALSLNRHIRQGWSQLLGLGEFIEVLPPQMRVSTNWYLGTADAVYQNIYSIGSEHSRYVIILSGDHIYKMNYQKMLQQHVDSGADVTVATFEVPSQEAAGRFGVIETDANWRIVGFEEKPDSPKRSHLHPDMVNASMGVYVFNTQLLIPALLADAEDPNSKHDFGKDILPRIFTKYRVYAYNFIDENKVGAQYWRDVGTIEAYYEANMDLVSVSPGFQPV